MTLYAFSTGIGPRGLYLLFVWLLSAAISAWASERKGYGERVGLTFGLLLSAIGLVIVLLLPARPGSTWKLEGWRPRRREHHLAVGMAGGASAATAVAPAPSHAEQPPAELAVGDEPSAETAVGDEPPAETAVGDEPPAETAVGDEPHDEHDRDESAEGSGSHPDEPPAEPSESDG